MQGWGALSSTLGRRSVEKPRSWGIQGTQHTFYGASPAEPTEPKKHVAKGPDCWECGDKHPISELTLCENCYEYLLCQKKENELCTMAGHLVWCRENEKGLSAQKLKQRDRRKAKFLAAQAVSMRVDTSVETKMPHLKRKRVIVSVGKGADESSLSRANLRHLRRIVSERDKQTRATRYLIDKLTKMEEAMTKAAKADPIKPLKAKEKRYKPIGARKTHKF